MLTEALCHYWGVPGREHDAALAWAQDLKWGFKRGVNSPPVVIVTGSRAVHLDPGPWGAGWYDEVGGLYLNFCGPADARAPLVIYACRGPMTTTHPDDLSPLCEFDAGKAWRLDEALDPKRVAAMRQLGGPRWDGSSPSPMLHLRRLLHLRGPLGVPTA